MKRQIAGSNSNQSCARPVLQHLARGVVGALCVVGALWIAPTFPLVAAFLGVSAAVALRGCPTCWAVGLFEIWREARQPARSHQAASDEDVARRAPSRGL